MSKTIATIVVICLSWRAFSQTAEISGIVYDAGGNGISNATVYLKSTSYSTLTDHAGAYMLKSIPYGKYTIACFYEGKQTEEQPVTLKQSKEHFNFILKELSNTLEEVVVTGEQTTTGNTHLRTVENFGIYEAKKSEVVVLGDLTINTASNNARQLYSKVTGLNIWESDQAGLQLGIGGRGLSPNRTANFNTRQNGYDISADALGYPESYYTPPAEALERIEIIRGAASLQ